MNTALLKQVARGLRYRTLDHLVGRSIVVRDLNAMEEAVRVGLGDDFPAECRLVAPSSIHGAVAKYGILDLDFSAPAERLGEAKGGVRLLRELGFLPTEEMKQDGDASLCFEMLLEDIVANRVFVKLFMEGGRPEEWKELRIPEGYLPRPFRIIDACVTNASGIWFLKHFYL